MKSRLAKSVYNKQGTMLFAIIFAMIAVLGFVSILSPGAGEEIVTPTSEIQAHSNYSGYLFRVVIVTLTMIIVLIVGLKIYRKQMKLSGKNNLDISTISRHYINDKQYLLKVFVEEKYLLLGVSDTSINFITELSSPIDEDHEKAAPFGTILDMKKNGSSQS